MDVITLGLCRGSLLIIVIVRGFNKYFMLILLPRGNKTAAQRRVGEFVYIVF